MIVLPLTNLQFGFLQESLIRYIVVEFVLVRMRVAYTAIMWSSNI